MKNKKYVLVILAVAILISSLAGYFYWEKEKSKKGIEWFQTGNTQPITQLQTKQSRELEYNRIGQMASLRGDIQTKGDVNYFINQNNKVLGLKWVRLSIDFFDWDEVETTGEYSKYYIDPNHNKVITSLSDRNIKITYCLVYYDEAIPVDPEEDYSRFKTEEEIQRYLDYVQFIVHNFKDRIEYYEILNEPESENPGQYVEVADYINLVKRAVPIIRQEHPEAKIVVGATPDLELLFGILNSDVMPLVDAVSWHPMYGTSPEYDGEYYYNYPAIVQEIKDVASSHGFKGEYIADELNWRTPKERDPLSFKPTYSETAAAKYYARGIVMHLGMNVTTGLALEELEKLPLIVSVVRNLCTIMAGPEPISLPIEIQSEATNIRSYSFSLPNGDKLIALWTDGVALDDDPGVKANLTLYGFNAQGVVGIDVLNSYQQPIITSSENGNLVIQNLKVRDYPLILHITKSSQ